MFQDALHTQKDVLRRAPWETRLAVEMFEALNADVLQSMRGGPVKLAMQHMMAAVEREFMDGQGGYKHGELLDQVHDELRVINRGEWLGRR